MKLSFNNGVDRCKKFYASMASHKWTMRVGLGVLASLALYSLVGFLGVPMALRHLVLAGADERFEGTLEVGHFRFNPFTWVLKVEDFEGRTPDGEVVVSFSQFRLNLQPSSVFGDAYRVREVLLDQPQGILHIDQQGQVNLAALFGMKKKVERADSGPFVIPPLVIDHLEVRDAGLRVRIETFDPPFEREAQNISIVMSDLRTDASHENSYHFSLVTSDDERLVIDGSLYLDPLSAVGRVSLQSLKMSGLTGFGSALVDARIGSGVMDLDFNYRFRPLAEQPELGVEDGVLNIKGFTLLEPGGGNLIHRVGALRLDGFFFDVVSRSTGMDSLTIDDASLLMTRGKSGGFRWLEKPHARSSASGSSRNVGKSTRRRGEIQLGVIADDKDMGLAFTEASQQFRTLGVRDDGRFSVALQQFVITNSGLRFRDQSVEPRVDFDVNGLNAKAGPYVSSKGRPLQFDLAMKLSSGATGGIKANGSVMPMEPLKSTRLEIFAQGLGMSPFAGYIAPVIGRSPTRGMLTATLNYEFKEGRIEGSNALNIDRLKLGARIKKTNAPRLPLNLAIALLEDRKGIITIDIPVEGDADDPKFSYAGMVTYAIRNVIQKIASSPFDVLSGLIPGRDGVEKNAVAFAKGESLLSPDANELINKLATIMESRPRLALELTPSYVPKVDAKALSELRFRRSVNRLIDKGESREDAIKKLHDDLPRNQRAGWLFRDTADMEQAVRAALKADEKDLRKLAEERAKAVRDALVSKDGIKASRVQIFDAVEARAPRVNLGFGLAE